MQAKRSYTFEIYWFVVMILLVAFSTVIIATGLWAQSIWNRIKSKTISYISSGKEIRDNVTRTTTTNSN